MKISLIYPGHDYSTFDVAAGYEKALRALGHEVIPFNFHKALIFYNHALATWEEYNPAYRSEENAWVVMASERAIMDVIYEKPDVILIISGFVLHKRAFDMFYRLGVPVVLLLTESPYMDNVQGKIVVGGNVALTLTNDECSLDTLPGRVVYLPHSYDPERHYPRRVNGEHRSDVFFHGTLFPERLELFEGTQANGRDVRIGGTIPGGDQEENLARLLANEELAQFYCGTRIALNHHRHFIGLVDNGKRRKARIFPHSLGPRAYEIAACGAFQLCDDKRVELWDVFDDSVATYSDAGELGEQVEYYLTHEAERQEMAAESMHLVQGCTFENRARAIVIPALEEVL